MTTHIAILPIDLIESLSTQLEAQDNHGHFLRLPHPRTGLPTLFLHNQSSGTQTSSIVEVQMVSPDAGRSWFLGQNEVISDVDGKLVLMTPVDPAFLLFPILQAAFPSGTATSFRTLEDIFEQAATKLRETTESPDAPDGSSQVSDRDLHTLSLLRCVEKAMRKICDFKDVTPEISVFRFSKEKYAAYLVKKARRLGESEVILKCETLVRGLAKNGLMDDNKEDLLKAGVLKVACEMVSQYISPETNQELLSNFDFSALDAHIEELDRANLALTIQESDKGAKKSKAQKPEENAGGKRKAAAQGSKGVEKLKKANVKGMAKLSTFFQKPAAKS
ncbi:hypothetical protein SCHPADRAFT_913867 [Schizopora paradoxa]|uniref:Ribonuclease H2 subunit B n=1 Tax=Schizopora paradoxa TaxID=27342 RepID=A0A0H2S5M2_9AGAM|nr:hypothetical protein SCHPADRAFT_913867 [Schizopora paradoxa]